MSARELLIFEHGGTRWGVERAAVRGFGPAGQGVKVSLGKCTLHADRVVGLRPAPPLRQPGRILRRFWPVSTRGLAVVEGEVVVVIDPAAPPPALAARSNGGADA